MKPIYQLLKLEFKYNDQISDKIYTDGWIMQYDSDKKHLEKLAAELNRIYYDKYEFKVVECTNGTNEKS